MEVRTYQRCFNVFRRKKARKTAKSILGRFVGWPEIFFKALQILQPLIRQYHHFEVIRSITRDRFTEFFPGLAIAVPLKIAITDFAPGVVDHPKDLLFTGLGSPDK